MQNSLLVYPPPFSALERAAQWLPVFKYRLPVCTMEVLIDVGASIGSPHGDVKWHSRIARSLHNPVGHTFRRAKAQAGISPIMRNGLCPAGHVATWTKTFHAHLSTLQTESAPQGKHRALIAHDTNTSTAVPEQGIDDESDDAVSCATTLSWNHGRCSTRRPRNRPG